MIKNPNTLKECFKISRSDYDKKVKNKLLEERKGKPCIRYHSLGYCFEKCGQKATHREITKAEGEELKQILTEAGVKNNE